MWLSYKLSVSPCASSVVHILHFGSLCGGLYAAYPLRTAAPAWTPRPRLLLRPDPTPLPPLS